MQDVFCSAACNNAKHSKACYGVEIDNQITVPILLIVCWGSYFLPFRFFVDNCLLKQHPVQTLFSGLPPQKLNKLQTAHSHICCLYNSSDSPFQIRKGQCDLSCLLFIAQINLQKNNNHTKTLLQVS